MRAGGIDTNVPVHADPATHPVVVLVHRSGPGVTAFANGRLTMPALAEDFCVVAPDKTLVRHGRDDRVIDVEASSL